MRGKKKKTEMKAFKKAVGSKYIPIIGIEVHAQLNSKFKLFSFGENRFGFFFFFFFFFFPKKDQNQTVVLVCWILHFLVLFLF